MRRTGTMESDHFSEENTYSNMIDLNAQRKKDTAKAKDIPVAGSTQYRVTVVLGVLLILVFLIVAILTSLLFIYYQRLSGIDSHLENNDQRLSGIQSYLENNGSLSSGIQSIMGTVRKLEDIQKANNSNVMSKVTEIESSLKLILTDKAAEKISETCTSCPDGWQLIKSNCYYFQDNGETWEQSVVECAKLNSALLVLKNRAELDALLPIIAKRRFWLGLRRNSKDLSSFLWTDGRYLTFRAWFRGEPNNAGDKEHCAEILGELKAMNDRSCDTKTSYICKRLLTC